MDLTARLERFAPVTLTADRSRLDGRQHVVVRHLIEAGWWIGQAYLRQVWPGNLDLRATLAAADDAQSRAALRLFDLMGGPWDRMDGDAPFLEVPPRPAAGGFYPEDLTRQEFEGWLTAHPEDRPAFTGYFSVIRRRGNALEAVPYHRAYQEQVEPAAQALQRAAALADHPPLAEYLRLRAQALLDDRYFESDRAWVNLQDGPIEVVIGPYEVYDDRLFGYKAAYECLVGLRDPEESARLNRLVTYLPAMAAHLPVPPEYRGKVAGLASPIVVTDTVYNSGEMATAAIATAFVLPNEPRTRATIGTKKVMVRNVARAKFENIFYPIAQDTLDPDQAASVTFEVYFAHVLLHEISHALGVREVPQADGSYRLLHQILGELFSPIEECKADVVGMHNLLFLAEEGVFPREWSEAAMAVYTAGIPRMVRTGGGAHARGELLAFNFMRERGAIRQDRETGRLRVEFGAMRQAIAELSEILLRIGGDGARDRAQALVERYVLMSRELEEAIGRVRPDLPLDLAPSYPWAA